MARNPGRPFDIEHSHCGHVLPLRDCLWRNRLAQCASQASIAFSSSPCLIKAARFQLRYSADVVHGPIESTAFNEMQAFLSMKVPEDSATFFPMGKLASRIKLVRKRAKLSQEKFAETLGTVEGIKVTRGAVGNWELGGGISLANLAAISETFGVPLDWLQHGKGEVPQNIQGPVKLPLTSATEKPDNISEQFKINARFGDLVRGFSKIPVKGQAMGGREGYLILSDQNFGEVLAPPSLADIPDAYAVYVVGDSMLERYQHGEIVYVHPYQPIRANDDCVIQIRGGEGEPPRGFVKRFISMDDKRLRVLQLNPKKVLYFPRSQVIAVHRIVMGGPA